LEELRRMDREAETITDPAVKQVFGERVQVLAGKYLEDEEVLAVANRILGRLDMPRFKAKAPVAKAERIRGRLRERLRFRLLREMVQQRRLFLHRLWKSHFRQLPRPSTLLFLL
jgi:hypothetical protein